MIRISVRKDNLIFEFEIHEHFIKNNPIEGLNMEELLGHLCLKALNKINEELIKKEMEGR
jgi:hypothetical protein